MPVTDAPFESRMRPCWVSCNGTASAIDAVRRKRLRRKGLMINSGYGSVIVKIICNWNWIQSKARKRSYPFLALIRFKVSISKRSFGRPACCFILIRSSILAT